MIEISTLENILIGFALFFLTLYGIASLAQTKPHWFRSKAFLKTKKMQQKYDKMVQSRRDMLHHYYRNKSQNKKSQMTKIQKQIIQLDKQLEQMRAEYEMVRKGLPVPLKMF